MPPQKQIALFFYEMNSHLIVFLGITMVAVAPGEVQPGLVLHLDTDVLRAAGGSETNAEMRNSLDRAVVGPHYFLVLEVDDHACLAVPLFSKSAPGSERLSEGRKAGLAEKWMGDMSYFSRWQHWRIPLAAIAAASADEESDPTNRRTYGIADTAELNRISDWKDRNRAAWRDL